MFQDFFATNNSYLISNLIRRNLKIRYRGSIAGMLWTVLIPASTAIVYFVIFKYVMKVQIENYLTFIMSGLIPWAFFNQATAVGLEGLVNNQSLLNKVPIPPQSLVIADTMTSFLNLIYSLPVLLIVILLSQLPFHLGMLQYLIFSALLLIFTHCISLILALLYVHFRDLKFLYSIVLQFWFYLTPILYAESMIPEKLRQFLVYNPLYSFFAGLHSSILSPELISMNTYLTAIAWTTLLFILSLFLLKRYKYRIVEWL